MTVSFRKGPTGPVLVGLASLLFSCKGLNSNSTSLLSSSSPTSSTSFLVSASGTNLTFSPNAEQTVNGGGSATFTVTPANGYSLSNTVSGTCAAGSFNGSIYTTGAIMANCTVILSATLSGGTVNSPPSATPSPPPATPSPSPATPSPSAAVGILASYYDPEAATTLVSFFTLANGTLPQPLNLGSVAVGDQNVPTATFVVQNNGTATLSLSNLSIPAPFVQAQGFSSSSLAAGAQSTFQVTVPSASAGTFTGNIQFTTNDPKNATVIVPIQGVAQ